jgi:hypothetical protein
MFDTDLLLVCAEFTLSHAKTVQDRVLEELQTSGATRLVKALKMLRLQRATLVIGMFSLFESMLQSTRRWNDPFERLRDRLKEAGKLELAEIFNDYRLAVNVLKHGNGRSYQSLLAKSESLEFKIKPEAESFFFEGDVSEVNVLIDVDEKFVRRSAILIQEVSALLQEI